MGLVILHKLKYYQIHLELFKHKFKKIFTVENLTK